MKQILFSPRFDVGDIVYAMYQDEIQEFRIVTRNFIDHGEEGWDTSDKESVKQDNQPVIHCDTACKIRDFEIRYDIELTGSGSDPDRLYKQDKLFKSPLDLINALHKEAMKNFDKKGKK